MTAGLYPLTIEQGAVCNINLTWQDGNRNPVNLTGWTAALMIRQNANDPAPLISLSSPSNGIVLGGSAGTIAITISAANTAALNPGGAVYDLKMTDGSGNPQRLLEGPVTISAAVTR